MIVNIAPKSSDDPMFIAALNGMVANLVDAHRPNEVYFVRIDRWFDHKWLRYSGRARVAFDGGLWRDTALDPIWQQKLTFPPFNPNRVVEQTSYRWIDNSYRPNEDARDILGPSGTHSARNLQNRVADFTHSGLFAWFSSGTAQLDHASVMSYVVEEGVAATWFASFLKSEGSWHVHRTKGIDQSNVETWFPPGDDVRRL